MIKIKAVIRIPHVGQVIEDFEVSSLETAKDEVKESVRRFNKEEERRYGSETFHPRKFVSVVVHKGGTNESKSL